MEKRQSIKSTSLSEKNLQNINISNIAMIAYKQKQALEKQ